MDKVLRVYEVWPHFPSISISGSACMLDCQHCSRVYIEHMIPATTPEELSGVIAGLIEEGRRGLLISGGCDREGRLLNLGRMLPVLERSIGEHDLIVKLHTGLVDRKMAQAIASSGVQIASMEMPGSREVISGLFNLDKTVDDYIETFQLLRDEGVPYIAPHVAVGLPRSGLEGAMNALELLHDGARPDKIVAIVFRPTIGTPLEREGTAVPGEVELFIERARELFPDKPVVLGSMRPRSSKRNDPDHARRYKLEEAALSGGIHGIEMPSRELLGIARFRGYRLKEILAYAVLPEEMEERVGSRWL